MDDLVIPANPAIWSFGAKPVCDALVQFCRAYPGLPLVSVGCGTGLIERRARPAVDNDFFLVDPAPFSYYPQVRRGWHRLVVEYGMPITHSYTSELVAEHPTLATGNQCLLLLNWCDFGDDAYDLEALRLLKPCAILAVIDKTGSAGSGQFHKFMKETGDYKLTSLYSLHHTPQPGDTHPCSHDTICMQWWHARDASNQCLPVATKNHTTYQCMQTHDATNEQNIKVLESRAAVDNGLKSAKLLFDILMTRLH